MTCREFREKLRRDGTRAVSGETLRHAATCAACAAETRALSLLRIGSERDEDATPGPGFEERLRARLAGGPPRAPAPAWNGGFDLLVRPALTLATALVLLCAGLYIGAGGAQSDDLASLVDSDAIFTSVLGMNPDAMFAEPQGTPAPGDAP
jgi:hypothetical protein